MFRTASIAGFIVLAIMIVCHAATSKKGAVAKCKCKCGGGFFSGLRKLVALGTLACFAVLLVTGFYPKLILKETLSGYLLMIHASAAPPFAACVAAAAILWADKRRLDKNYLPWLNKLLKREPKSTEAPRPGELSLKVAFWVVMILAIPLIMSIVLSMLPLFGTHMQEVMADLHRYTALVVALAGIFYIYLSMRKAA